MENTHYNTLGFMGNWWQYCWAAT